MPIIPGMKLDQWLTESGMSQLAFAKLADVQQSSINRFINGESLPDWSTIEKIRVATKDAVTAADWAETWRDRQAEGQGATVS